MKKYFVCCSLWLLLTLSMSAQGQLSGTVTLTGAANPIDNCESSYTSGAYGIGKYVTGDKLPVTHVCRTWFQFDLSLIPADVNLTGVTVNYGNGGGSYTFKLTKLLSVNSGDLSATWAAIGNSSSLHTGLPYGGSPFSSNAIMTYISDNIKSKVMTMYIGALSENENTAGSQSAMSLQLEVSYTYTAAHLTLVVQNDLGGNGSTGNIGAEIYPASASPKASPRVIYPYENNTLNLAAYDNQVVAGKTYLFNDNEGPAKKSFWDIKRTDGNLESWGYYQAFTSRNLVKADDYALIVAHLNKFKVTTGGSLTENEEWYTNVTLTGDVYVPSGYDLKLNREITVNLNGHSIISQGGTITNPGASITGLAAYIKSSTNSIIGYYSSFPVACSLVISNQAIVLQAGTFTGAASLSSKNYVTITGQGSSTIINGSINVTNCASCTIQNLRVTPNNMISTSYGNVNLYNVNTNGNYSTAISFYNGADFLIDNWISSSSADMTSGECLLVNTSGGGELTNSTIEGQEMALSVNGGASFHATNDYFCGNLSDVWLFSGLAVLKDCSFSFAPERANHYMGGMMVYQGTSSICTGLRKSNLASSDKSFSITDEPGFREYLEIDSAFTSLIDKKNKKALDSNTSDDETIDGFQALIAKSKDLLDKYPSSGFSRILAGKISKSYLISGSLSGLKDFVQQASKDSKFSSIKPYIKRNMIDYYLSSKDYDNALLAADEVISMSVNDPKLKNEMFYEKGIIYKYLKANESEADSYFAEVINSGSADKNMLELANYQLSDKNPGKKDLTPDNASGLGLSNYPNPFNPATVIKYSLPNAARVSLKVYDMLGKEVVTLVNEYKKEGSYSVQFNASKLPSGTYIYELRAGSMVKSGKMLLVK